MSHQPQHKHSILHQVLIDELSRYFLVCFTLDFVHEPEVFLNVAVPVHAEDASKGPGEETEAHNSGHKHHPEPDEQVDLLVEEVNGQHALHGVPLHVPQSPHFEIAHGDAGKARGLRPVLPAGEGLHHIDTVEVVVGAEEDVEDEELADDVGDVDELTEDVEDGQVVAVTAAADQAAGAGQAVLDAHRTARLVLLLTR